jgi:hypothetical protein
VILVALGAVKESDPGNGLLRGELPVHCGLSRQRQRGVCCIRERRKVIFTDHDLLHEIIHEALVCSLSTAVRCAPTRGDGLL